ncbi:hypothetical protein A3B42_04215 [Candidatus Daviesbacteria bacterium RIFCSPLOWO2_01_FULL_38_10]|uniref:Uncharacterized protein n=1 Tax=Candidatus Daviesbacteria bacterium GW2011_GWF2_38_6 TaxID=1618432 RepID=A0A0G0KHB0_9BACT|nr:MAG: hypothetical protein US80_C0003G0010 [Candidatus Daviesbacteria bacterium GW2011_GWA2_38_17]KKQ79018.1 MAG: hypothetical protein US99_C0005G0010 [Candidatus Daviesbacteria bacterium GW2011_GWF2_38_6]OGE26075.1 MAG: hypothetical protein A3D02_03535 [Candidatus Daviesbacteria bacterium RIFCSPHIGHO2_02_FULL_39_41]OGE40315.1 MAG: hypothetical protein A3B42_04215 [Candidatus Daviesbacteria bacterium RIFCSPLOWO2_01_FULL_38_10]OGE44887.1 MAG: hypothetical protein A3E67_00565 [Candidatus Davies
MNNTNVIGQFQDEIEQTSGEVAESVKDSVGEAIEQGVQSVVGTNLTPQQIQEKEQDRQKQLSYTRKWLGDLQRAQEKVRAENKQKEQQRLQAQEEEKKVSEMKKEEKKKKPVNPAIAYAGKVEIKRGVGG